MSGIKKLRDCAAQNSHHYVKKMTSRKLTTVLLVFLGLQLPALRAGPVDLDGLLSRSPFSGPTSAVTVASNIDSALEFRGVLVDRGETFFSLYEASSRSSLWVGLNEAGNPYVVQNYDSSTAQVVVQYQGRTLTLPLKQAKVVAAAAVAAPAAVTNLPPANSVQSVAPAAPAEEARRLAAVADEIRRRRALRQQTTQASAPASPSRN